MKKNLLIAIVIVFLAINAILYVIFIKKPATNKQISQKEKFPGITLLQVTPVVSGDPFKEPVIQEGQQYAVYVMRGRIQDMAKTKNGYSIGFVTDTGSVIKEVATVPLDFKARLYVSSTKQTRDFPLADIMKDDSLLVSFNIDMRTKSLSVTDIVITRP